MSKIPRLRRSAGLGWSEGLASLFLVFGCWAHFLEGSLLKFLVIGGIGGLLGHWALGYLGVGHLGGFRVCCFGALATYE
jgi:hypothetical protein